MASSSLRARRVFVDSSAFLALRDQDDEHYQAASALLEQLIDGHYRLFTTNTVIIEAHALILSTLGIAAAAEFLRDVQGTSLRIVRTRAQDEELARRLIFQYQDKRFSFTDAISFVVMERLGMRLAFSFDRNFIQYGFSLLTPELL